MIIKRVLGILENLSEDSYTTASELARILQVSSRTVRNDITELNRELMRNGALIESKARYGMRLCIQDKGQYQAFVQNLRNQNMGEDAESRIWQIMEYLLVIEDSVKMDDLCDMFFVSRSTMKSDMQIVRKILKDYHLTLDYRANQGLKVLGKEQNVRKCLTYIQREELNVNEKVHSSDITRIRSIIESCVSHDHFEISDFAITNLAFHIYISIMRIRSGNLMNLDTETEDRLSESMDLDLVLMIVDKIEQEFSVHFPKEEIFYILIQVSGKKIVTAKGKKGNTVVSDEVYQMVSEMLSELNEVFKIDFRYDFELITALAMHLVPLETRLKHDIAFQNSMVVEVRQHILLAYNMASVACEILEKKYVQKMSVDEVTFIALHFYVALERKQNKQKENILIVCGSGKASSELLVYQVREKLGNCLNVIGSTSRYSLNDYDFEQVDYILTTVPIDITVPVPIIMTRSFFEGKELKQVEKVIADSHTDRVIKYFKRDMIFWSDITEKNDVLKFLCDKATECRPVPDKFYESVLAREEIGRTCFGNFVSIAHPIHPMGTESFVGLMILEKPIIWDEEMVQLVFLLSMKENGDHGMQDFYKIMGKLVSHRELVAMLIKTRTYEEVIDVIKLASLEGES